MMRPSSDTESVGSSGSDKGALSGSASPVVRDRKLFKSTGLSKSEFGSLGKRDIDAVIIAMRNVMA